MFGKLKEKLKSWFKKSKEKVEGTIEEEVEEEKKIEKLREEVEEISEPELKPKAEKKEKGRKGILKKLKSKLKFKISEEYFEEIFSDLEFSLLENNVAIDVVEKIKAELKKELVGEEVKKEEIEEKIKESLKNSVSTILKEPFDLIEKIKGKEGSFVIVFFGINGCGKTTTIAKVANLLLKNNISCVLAASDTFRAASIEQLEKHASNLGVKVIKSNYGADPASVAFDAIKHANSRGIKAVLIDTAGRMHTKADLMREMEKICRVAKPDLKIFVAESITGNDAVQQAKNFDETVGVDAVILTKADVDEKGGTAISISYVLKKPILFLGVGQGYGDLRKFRKEGFLKSIGL